MRALRLETPGERTRRATSTRDAVPRPERIREAAPVVIEYCAPGNHAVVARRLARAIEKEFGLRPRLVPSRGGVFEVSVGGRLVFSKKASWRFPADDEIFYHVRQLNS